MVSNLGQMTGLSFKMSSSLTFECDALHQAVALYQRSTFKPSSRLRKICNDMVLTDVQQ